jgi:hypothetical protein
MPLAEVKAKRFAKAYMDNGMNAKAALRTIEPKYRDLSDKGKQRVAEVKASRLLSNDKVKRSLAELMDESGLTDDKIKKILDRNASQTKNIPASNQAVDIALKVKGAYAPEKKMTVNLDLSGNLDESINLLMTELETLKQLSAPKYP